MLRQGPVKPTGQALSQELTSVYTAVPSVLVVNVPPGACTAAVQAAMTHHALALLQTVV